MGYINGPYVQAACFCETVIEDKSGVLSLIRMIDTVISTATGEHPPEDMIPFIAQLKLVVMLKSGEARGRNTLRILPELPAGQTEAELPISIYFEGEEKGTNRILNLNYQFKFEGLHWFHIFVGEEEVTAIPLRVKYQRNVSRVNVGS
jgi:hypothetical protein